MIEQKLTKAWESSCLRSLMIMLVMAIVFVLLFIALIIISTFLKISMNFSADQLAEIWMVGIGILLLLLIIGTSIWLEIANRNHAKKMDAIFVPFGLIGKSYALNGRQYHGTIQGRQVDAYFYRGPSLDIYVASSVKTRMGIGLKGRYSQFLSGDVNRPELTTDYPEFAASGVYPLDEAWARGLMENPDVRAAIARLTSTESTREYRNVLFQPEAIELQVHHTNKSMITIDRLDAWVSDLFTLVRMVESMPEPTVTAITPARENQARLNRGIIVARIYRILGGITAFIMLVAILILVLSSR